MDPVGFFVCLNFVARKKTWPWHGMNGSPLWEAYGSGRLEDRTQRVQGHEFKWRGTFLWLYKKNHTYIYYMHILIYIWIHTYIYICVYIFRYIYMYIHFFTYMYIHILYTYINLHLNTYIYMYIYLDIFTCIYILWDSQ